ncbi:transglycosylase SLT domain-containing protein [uncultured Microscilla sp.]|uniref:transglycosylase SLT domain-containing protein n=1 Tax=uncultured Microscilla sp. TaxID=432653 RepID=UPI00261098CC|nr:transglycosylase SLT domain-containing protein [uncultured Microscilla sp.]
MALPYENIALNRYGQGFITKVKNISKNLGIKPSWLMEVMNSESGLRHDIRNNIGAVGFIQFLPQTAYGLGTSPDSLANMTGTAQLDYVQKYYAPYSGRMKNPIDLYIVAFYPYALGKSDNYIVGSEQGDAYARLVKQQNAPFDLNKDGYVSLGEFRRFVRKKFKNLPESDFTGGFLGLGVDKGKVFAISGFVLLGLVLGIYYFRKQIFGFYKTQAKNLQKAVDKVV